MQTGGEVRSIAGVFSRWKGLPQTPSVPDSSPCGVLRDVRAYACWMPELPEVEITARRLSSATEGAVLAAALAPGMNTMKTFDPPLDALTGKRVTGVRRVGKMPVVGSFDELKTI